MAEVGFEGSGCCGGQVHLQGGTHKEMLLPVDLVVDGAPRLLAKAGVSFGVTRVDRLTSRSMILTLREVLTKRHCVLKVRLGL